MFLRIVDTNNQAVGLNIFHISMVRRVKPDVVHFSLINGEIVEALYSNFDDLIISIEELRKAACTSSR